MTRHDDNQFEVKPRPPRARRGPRSDRFVSRVLVEVRRAGGAKQSVSAAKRPGSRIGRGFTASRLHRSSLGPRARHVVIKTRVVVLNTAGAAAMSAHLRYIARDGVTRDGEAARSYSARADRVDLRDFQTRGAHDRHQFRFIVAPEDATELADLRGFTRHLMTRMETDLGTRLDWVAVDHWDTDNPHTHIVLRGKDAAGGDLVIAGDYIARGMRMRAGELATEWLGPRTDLEIQTRLKREVEQERWTSLDRELKDRSKDGVVDLHEVGQTPGELGHRARLLGRLQHLRALGVAREDRPGEWTLRADAEDLLRALADRGDIIRTMQRALGKGPRELSVFDPANEAQPIVGRIATKGLVNELGEQGYVVVDGLDGRGHYVALPVRLSLDELPLGCIVSVRATSERAADRNVLNASRNGMYHPTEHRAALATTAHRADADEIVASHVRRLEALRRAGVVQRLSEGLWRVPKDLVARGEAYDRRRLGAVTVQLQSHLSIEKQVRAVGATWLDQQLVDQWRPAAAIGFAGSVRDALKAREDFLVERGFAERRDAKVVVPLNLLTTLRDHDVAAAARLIAVETGLTHRAVTDGASASGVYRRSVQLASGRFAMLDDGLGFSLVPWRPVIVKRLGQPLTAVVRGDNVVWRFGRDRGPSIG